MAADLSFSGLVHLVFYLSVSGQDLGSLYTIKSPPYALLQTPFSPLIMSANKKQCIYCIKMLCSLFSAHHTVYFFVLIVRWARESSSTTSSLNVMDEASIFKTIATASQGLLVFIHTLKH